MKSREMPLISVIVPIYNTAAYLRKCLDSIIQQTYFNLEIVLIDDGSTDGSLMICEEYKAKDDRIIVIHKENGGQSSARNAGLDFTSAPVIGFVDSDDYIEREMFQQLIQSMQEFNADIAMCGVADVFNGKIKVKRQKDKHYVLDSLAACEMVLKGRLNATIMPNKLFKASLFQKIRFPIGKIMEDDFICTKLFLASERVAILTQPYYYYVHRPGSTTTSTFKISDLDPIEAYNQNLELVQDAYPSLIHVMQERNCWARFYALDKLYLGKQETLYPEIEEGLIEYLKSKKQLILFGNFFSIIKKIGFLTLLLSPKLYQKLLNMRG